MSVFTARFCHTGPRSTAPRLASLASPCTLSARPPCRRCYSAARPRGARKRLLSASRRARVGSSARRPRRCSVVSTVQKERRSTAQVAAKGAVALMHKGAREAGLPPARRVGLALRHCEHSKALRIVEDAATRAIVQAQRVPHVGREQRLKRRGCGRVQNIRAVREPEEVGYRARHGRVPIGRPRPSDYAAETPRFDKIIDEITHTSLAHLSLSHSLLCTF